MDNNLMIWNESIDEIVSGYKETEENYICVLCSSDYKKGKIYNMDNNLYDAYGAVRHHVQGIHGHTVDFLLKKPPVLTGISDIQQNILKLMSDGDDDKTIAHKIGIAYSTVRNHRYKLREKQKQAKLFIALMESLEFKISRPINKSDNGNIEELHASAHMVDDRYNITDSESEKVIKTYMEDSGAIKQFPSKEKKKIILLREVIKNFVPAREYSEKEINRILQRIYNDFATIRRALIEYGFLERSNDCMVYRVKE